MLLHFCVQLLALGTIVEGSEGGRLQEEKVKGGKAGLLLNLHQVVGREAGECQGQVPVE